MSSTTDRELLFTFEFHRDGLPAFRVIRFEGQEAVSRLYHFDILLVTDTADVDLDTALNATATLRIRSRDLSRSVPYHGMVSGIEQLGQVDEHHFFRLTLVPRLWRLGLRHINDVYLDEYRIPDIVRHLLERHDLRGPDVRMAIQNPALYRQRSFICQFDESDLNFVSRWMEQEGLYYFFDHEDPAARGEVLHIIDFKEAQPDRAVALRYTPPENVQTDRQDSCLTAFTCRKTHVPGKVLVKDFNFRDAALEDNLNHETEVAGGRKGLRMFYGDNVRSENDVRRLATVRAQELACQGTVYQGTAPAIGVRSGFFLEVSHHFREEFNGRYWVTSVTHQGSQAGVVLAGRNTVYNREEQGAVYECRFTALDGTQQFRAERLTPKPIVHGVLNAIIDSEGEGEHAELNEYGQYKVQLMYDYPRPGHEKNSSWLRMATPYAGNRNGMHFPLLKGTEVLIGFVGGDPDQPLILAAVPNSENQNIVSDVNAWCNGVRTVAGNIMNMVDKPGQEAIALYSPKNNSGIYIGTFPLTGPDVTLDDKKSSDPASLIENME